MAKLLELKKQYPQFNISLIDYLAQVDKSDTNKFLPMILKI